MGTQPKLSTLRTEKTAPSTNVTLDAGSPIIQVMNPSTDIEVTLPSVDSEFKIINRSANRITVKSSNGDTIDSFLNGRCELVSTVAAPTLGSEWHVVNIEEQGTFSFSVTNVSGVVSTAGRLMVYQRKNDQVYGNFHMTSTNLSANSDIIFRVSIPVASNFAGETQANGIFLVQPLAQTQESSGGIIRADAANNELLVNLYNIDGGGNPSQGTFRYRIV